MKDRERECVGEKDHQQRKQIFGGREKEEEKQLSVAGTDRVQSYPPNKQNQKRNWCPFPHQRRHLFFSRARRFQESLWRLGRRWLDDTTQIRINDASPTNNRPLMVNFRLSPDAEILLLSANTKYKSAPSVQKVYAMCTTRILTEVHRLGVTSYDEVWPAVTSRDQVERLN